MPWLFNFILCNILGIKPQSDIILYIRPSNERQQYIVMSYTIDWVHAQNDPCIIQLP